MGSMRPAHLIWAAEAFKFKKSGIEFHLSPLLTRQVLQAIQASVSLSLRLGR